MWAERMPTLLVVTAAVWSQALAAPALGQASYLSRPIEVRAIDGTTGAAVAGARVRVLAADLPGIHPDEPGDIDFERLDRERARVEPCASTDQLGRASVPRPRAHGVVAVESGSLLGLVVVTWYDLEARDVQLWRDGAATVEVRDAEGRPAEGVPVALRSLVEASGRDLLIAATDASGRAHLPHAQFLRNRARAGSKKPLRWTLVPNLCGGSIEGFRWDEELPEGPVRLQLPATAEVELHVLEADGSPARGEVPVALVAVPRQLSEDYGREDVEKRMRGALLRPRPADTVAGYVVGTARDGRASFPYVAPGCELVYSAQRHGASALVSGRSPGPEKVGERKTFELRLGVRHTTVVARLETADGRPFADRQLLVEQFERAPTGGFHHVPISGSVGPLNGERTMLLCGPRTDARGEFRVELDLTVRYGGAPVLAVQAGIETPGHVACVIPLAHAPKSGLHDVGIARLARAPLIAGGRFVDQGQRPLAGCLILLDEIKAPWRHRTVTDAEGRFELRGVTFEESISLTTLARGRFPGHVSSVEPGRGDHILVGPNGRIVRGRLVPRTPGPLGDWDIRARRALRKEGSFEEIPGELEPDGTFEVMNLDQVEYTILISRGDREAERVLRTVDLKNITAIDLGQIEVGPP